MNDVLLLDLRGARDQIASPCSLLAPVEDRLRSYVPRKGGAERARRDVAYVNVDLGYTRLLPAQQVLCQRHPPAQQVLHRCHAHLAPEPFEERGPRECRLPREFDHGPSLARAVMHLPQRHGEPVVGEPAQQVGGAAGPAVERNASISMTLSRRATTTSRPGRLSCDSSFTSSTTVVSLSADMHEPR
jgi:hypothetical protein